MSAYRCHCIRHRNDGSQNSQNSQKYHYCQGHAPDVKQEMKNMLNSMFEKYERELEQQQKEEENNQKLISESMIPYVVCWESNNQHEWSSPDINGFKTCNKCDAIDMDELLCV